MDKHEILTKWQLRAQEYKLKYLALKDMLETIPVGIRFVCGLGHRLKFFSEDREDTMRVYMKCVECDLTVDLSIKDKRYYLNPALQDEEGKE